MTTTTSTTMKLFATCLLVIGLTTQARATLLVRYTYDEANSGTTNALNVGGSLGASADAIFGGVPTRTSDTPGGISLGALNLNSASTVSDIVAPATDLNGLDQLSTMTLSTWINIRGAGAHPGNGYYSIMSDIDATNKGWEFYYVPNLGAANMKLGFQVNATAKQTTSVVSADSTWVFIAATWDRTSGDVTLYTGTPSSAVTQVGSTLTGLTTTMTGNADPMRVGNDAFTSTPNAFMDDTRVYDNVLTLAQLDAVRLENLVAAPEPSSISLVFFGTIGLCSVLRRKRIRG